MPRTGCSVILYRLDKVLLVKRAKPPFEGHWSLPGGSQEFGETLEQCARRELAEETGLEVGILNPVATRDHISSIDGKPEYHFVLTTFLGTEYKGDLQAGDDAAECKWFALDDITGLETTPGLHEFLTAQADVFPSRTDKMQLVE